ncbi:MAG: EAL domain-containing protein, partial [Myxococcota bacterium]
RAFDEKAQYAWADAESRKSELALLICDLDFFKRVNDEYGHPAGDTVLVAAATALQTSVRPDDVVARFGGEEFVVLIKGAPKDTVIQIAERCAEAVRSLPIPDLVPGASRRQTISIGISTYAGTKVSLDQLIANADKALYDAKRAGRDRIVVYGDRVERTDASQPQVRPRLLLVDPDARRTRSNLSRLVAHYEVVTAANGVEALRLCARQPFDLFVSEEDVCTESGVSFLRKSFAFAPFSARMLILSSANAYLAIRATNVGRVDHLLLREDSESHLIEALEHARLKLDLVGQQRLGLLRPEALIETNKLEALQEVIRSGKLRFAYQPIVRSQTYEVVGFEALARPEASGFCTPTSDPIAMLEVAERMGAQWELGRIGRRSIADEIQPLCNEFIVFVNLHPTELANEQMLEETGLINQAHRIVLEITERAAIRDANRYASHIKRLRELGFRLAVDDLGAGYAGLNSVAQLQPDFIKIDMALTRAIDRWQIKRRLVASVVHFAKEEGIEIVAEGIETKEECETVEELGCSLQQGFLHGRPHAPSW